MLSKFILFILFHSFLLATPILDISKDITKKDFLTHLYCTDDKNNTLDFNNILHHNTLQQSTKSNLGFKFYNYWCKLDIANYSNSSIEKIFSNSRAGMDYLGGQNL